LENWVANNNLRELISRIRTFPTIPSIYFEILAQLNNPNSSTEDIGVTIAKDMAVMTKLLQILNSAYFGLSRKISEPAEAVGILGMDTVKSMVMAIKAMGAYDKVKPVYFSIDRLWRHSTAVARHAHQLTMMETDDSDAADAAYTAGLMHDVGKIVLASNFESQYRGVQSLANEKRRPLWEVEKEFFGASHAEIGAYLLGLWGIPWNLVEAAAMHHCPGKSQDTAFSPLTAVHVADVMAYELDTEDQTQLLPDLDLDYLARLGLGGRLEEWRMQLTLATAKRAHRPSSRPDSAAERRKSVTAPTLVSPRQPVPVLPEATILAFWTNFLARFRQIWQRK
jgi:HD-like signal output (HDOD) protein